MSISEMKALTDLMQRDPEYAWAWFCNLAMPIMDATNCSHKKANEAAAHLMQHLFGVDMTRDERYEYGKCGAQQYAEFRIAVDREEDQRLGLRLRAHQEAKRNRLVYGRHGRG